MKQSQVCPKCAGRRIWLLESFRIPAESGEATALPVVPHQPAERGSFFAFARLAPLGKFDVYLCASCGYSEFYARTFEGLREDVAHGVRLLDASPAPAGPFR